MAKFVPVYILTGYRSLQGYNADLAAIAAAFQNTLSLDGSTPNQMLAVLDMNSNRIINLGAPVNSDDAARLIDIEQSQTLVGALGSWIPVSVSSNISVGSKYWSITAGGPIVLTVPALSSSAAYAAFQVATGVSAGVSNSITLNPQGLDTFSYNGQLYSSLVLETPNAMYEFIAVGASWQVLRIV